jgi:Homeodomain-like domain
MRSADDVRRVFELWEEGHSKAAIARRIGVSRERVRQWLNTGLEPVLQSPMRQKSSGCSVPSSATTCSLIESVDEPAYAYLLGQYLGDGNISAYPRTFRLRISACDAYPGIMAEIEVAIRAVMPSNVVGRAHCIGCTQIGSYSKHWPCLFPQHGSGPKHLRPIELRAWQHDIALDRHPREFLRGLIHSDGCRSMNWVVGQLRDGPKRYTYPRYLFSNESADIRRLFTEACERVGAECRPNRRNSISVARRESENQLDAFIGPKY